MEEINNLLGLRKEMRGYDKAQVEALLEDLIVKYQNTKGELDLYKQGYARLVHQHQVMKNQFSEISNLSVRSQPRDDISRLALKEANALIEKAKRNADIILTEALEQVKLINQDIEKFQEEAKNYRESIVKMNDNLLNTIDQSHVYFLNSQTVQSIAAPTENIEPIESTMNVKLRGLESEVNEINNNDI